jgi:hypothetical protein
MVNMQERGEFAESRAELHSRAGENYPDIEEYLLMGWNPGGFPGTQTLRFEGMTRGTRHRRHRPG